MTSIALGKYMQKRDMLMIFIALGRYMQKRDIPMTSIAPLRKYYFCLFFGGKVTSSTKVALTYNNVWSEFCCLLSQFLSFLSHPVARKKTHVQTGGHVVHTINVPGTLKVQGINVGLARTV